MTSDSNVIPEISNVKVELFEHERVCSCCLSETETDLTTMHNHFMSDDGKMETYFDIINSCYGSKILNRSEMLKNHYICMLCIHRLLESYQFKSQIIEAQNTLLDYIRIRERRMKHRTFNLSHEKYLWKKKSVFDLDPKFIEEIETNLAKARRNDSSMKHSTESKIEENALDLSRENCLSSDDPLVELHTNLNEETDTDGNSVVNDIESKIDYEIIDVSQYKEVVRKDSPVDLNLKQDANEKIESDVDSIIDYLETPDNESVTKEVIEENPLDNDDESNERSGHPRTGANTKFQKERRNVKNCNIKIMVLPESLSIQPKIQTTKLRKSKTPISHTTKSRKPNLRKSNDEQCNPVKFLCVKCGRKFTTCNRFVNHSRTHSMSFPCKDCDKVFNKSNQLKNHILYHHRELRHSCTFCEKKFRHYETKRAHIRNVHLEEALRVGNSSDLSSELRVAKEKLKVHLCNICGKGFYTGYTLNNHMVVHYGERTHVCEVCGKAFARKFTLNLHKLVHKDKTHLCDHCGLSFVQKSSLKTHLDKRRCKNVVRTILGSNESFKPKINLKAEKKVSVRKKRERTKKEKGKSSGEKRKRPSKKKGLPVSSLPSSSINLSYLPP